jgi:hypothetical protein
MSSGGKWPTRWLSSHAKTPAEHEPVLQSYLGLEDDGPEQPPQAVSPPAWEGVPAAERPITDRPLPERPLTVRPQSPSAPVPVPVAPPAPPRMKAPDAPRAVTSAVQRPPAPPRSRMRAVIGDQLRAPALLCEFSGCSSRFTHPDALGERQLQDLAIAAGWQYDLIGRLACPSCVRRAPTFWSRRPQALTTRGE